jgi:hypothetical protein
MSSLTKLQILNSWNEASTYYLSMQPSSFLQTGSIFSNPNLYYNFLPSSNTGIFNVNGALSVNNGLYSINNFVGNFTDGIVVDYVTGNGRISVGPNDSLTIYTGGVGSNSIMSISSNGSVIMGGSLTCNTSQHVAVAGLSVANNAISNTNMQLPLVPQFDPNGWWKAASNTFMPKIAGWYQVNAQVWWNTGTGTGQMNSQVQKNGNTISLQQANTISSVGGLSFTHSTLVYCNGSTDAIGLTVYSTTPANGQQIQVGATTDGRSGGTFLQMFYVK